MNARALWVVLETVHGVTYFTRQARAAHEAGGMRGFWRGYVATRAAPLGAAGLGAVTAVFYNFAPSFLARSLPSIWSVVPPERALAARAEGAVTALRTYLPDLAGDPRLPEATDLLRRLVSDVQWEGRPLGAANAALPWPQDPVAALWQAATTLREHRGDGHVAALLTAGLDGVEAHVLRDAEDGSGESILPNRGWTGEDWSAARSRLADRGLLDGSELTERGRHLRAQIEQRTDALAESAYRAATPEELAWLDDFLRPYARRLVPAAVPHPNPVGNPPP
ncbi:hypothetical protein HFP15_30320 [Amycolatopsis sp. K13G38]|uniref:SalK n=1 Tax=Amycolatopsis acididurans TaxID=2724524 RepID=A0ABX1JFI6_9PSEU|nr:hypothetical protein [Amycolatopsis acididurans]NKQ57175.1 hypothetical protein [Amycolatopsis acididurans]